MIDMCPSICPSKTFKATKCRIIPIFNRKQQWLIANVHILRKSISELNSQRVRPPFKHVAEKIPQEDFLLVVDDTGKLSAQSLAEKVGLHPGAFHQDLLVMKHLQENKAL